MYQVSENMNVQYDSYSLKELLKEFLPVRIANKLWKDFEKTPVKLLDLSIEELTKEYSMTDKMANKFKAILSFSNKMRQLKVVREDKITSSYSLAEKLKKQIGHEKQEHLIALYLNNNNEIVEEKVLFVGSVNKSIADPKVILHHALKNLAVSIIIAHNHPSGNITPSSIDNSFTAKLEDACNLMDIRFLDHLIVTSETYYSYREEDMLG